MDSRVLDEIDRRVQAQGATWLKVKLDALRPAVWRTLLDDVNTPQRLCFRPEGWPVDEAGHQRTVPPGELPLAFADRWAYSRAKKWAVA